MGKVNINFNTKYCYYQTRNAGKTKNVPFNPTLPYRYFSKLSFRTGEDNDEMIRGGTKIGDEIGDITAGGKKINGVD